MATLCRKIRSPYWMVKFRDATGRIVMRSTKQKKLTEARIVAEKWENAARVARSGELTQAASIKILSELMESTTKEKLNVESIHGFLTGWLASRITAGRSTTTVNRYKPIIDGFLNFLTHARHKGSVGSLTVSEIEKFRDLEIAAGKGATTANFSVKIIRTALNAAKRKGLSLTNPADAVELIEAHAEERTPFTDSELKALLTTTRDSDWQGAILLGVWAGLRLSDVAALTWGAIDTNQSTLTLSPIKTSRRTGGKRITIALHEEVMEWLSSQPTAIASAPLLPKLFNRKSGSHAGLSNEFKRLMQRAGIAQNLGAKKSGRGRQFHGKGFHALRHTMISRLAAANISADVRKVMVGHASDKIHSRYTHLDVSAQKTAISTLTRIA